MRDDYFVWMDSDGAKDSRDMTREELLTVIKWLIQERDSLKQEVRELRANLIREWK